MVGAVEDDDDEEVELLLEADAISSAACQQKKGGEVLEINSVLLKLFRHFFFVRLL